MVITQKSRLKHNLTKGWHQLNFHIKFDFLSINVSLSQLSDYINIFHSISHQIYWPFYNKLTFMRSLNYFAIIHSVLSLSYGWVEALLSCMVSINEFRANLKEVEPLHIGIDLMLHVFICIMSYWFLGFMDLNFIILCL